MTIDPSGSYLLKYRYDCLAGPLVTKRYYYLARPLVTDIFDCRAGPLVTDRYDYPAGPFPQSTQSNPYRNAGVGLQPVFSLPLPVKYRGQTCVGPAVQLLQSLQCRATQSSPLLDNYLLANTAGMDHPKDCRDTCRKVHLCAIPNVDITNFRKCISQANMAVRVGREWWGVKVMLVMVVFCMY